MTGKRTITVFGATGQQGGALARAVLEDRDGEFTVRAVTRDPGSERARELARLGAEVVRADLDDEASLGPVLEGAHGAYLVTDFWADMDAGHEQRQAAALARATGHAGVQHAIWSTLEDTRACIPLEDGRMPTLQDRFKVPHFDAKAEADQYFLDAGVPVTFLRTTFYWENLYGAFAPHQAEDGALELSFPMGEKRLAGISVEDIGKTAYAIFRTGADYVASTISIAGEHLRLADMAEAMTEALGRPVRYRPLTPDAFRGLGFPGADEAGNMFQYYADCEAAFTSARDLEAVRGINPELQDFATWLAGHRERFAAS
ncbi:NmrA/HSCARG family protein [Streptomyces sp. NPDC097619]|uniref:NmrA/HSCARG family protein n=1 Tax=Streptomyces sp. NPDC097619 TaxID=3157228 RepID=UPI003325CE65